MEDIIQEVLKWMNGIGDIGNSKQTTINYPTDSNLMPTTIKFNSEAQVSRIHPVQYGKLNPPRDGITFNV